MEVLTGEFYCAFYTALFKGQRSASFFRAAATGRTDKEGMMAV